MIRGFIISFSSFRSNGCQARISGVTMTKTERNGCDAMRAVCARDASAYFRLPSRSTFGKEKREKGGGRVGLACVLFLGVAGAFARVAVLRWRVCEAGELCVSRMGDGARVSCTVRLREERTSCDRPVCINRWVRPRCRLPISGPRHTRLGAIAIARLSAFIAQAQSLDGMFWLDTMTSSIRLRPGLDPGALSLTWRESSGALVWFRMPCMLLETATGLL